MRLPTLSGLIKRRLLVNYRADPEFVQRLLPKRMRPKVVEDVAMVGICLIRLEGIRPQRREGSRGLLVNLPFGRNR